MTNRINTIDVHELKKRWDTHPELQLIDVRETHEWQEKHIVGALHIPKDEIATRISAHITEADSPVYLFCRGGTRSIYAANTLLNLGYQNVYSIDGGITAWEASGYPVK